MGDEGRAGYHHGDLERALVDEAFEQIRRDGAGRFSLRAAARAVGVDAAAAYRHFANKQALLAAVGSRAFSHLAQRMEAATADLTDPVARFTAVGHAYVGFAVDEPALFRMVFGPRSEPARGTGDGGLDPYEILMASLVELADGGALRGTPEEAALPAWAAVHGLAHLAIDGRVEAGAVQDATAGVIAALLEGLLQSTEARIPRPEPEPGAEPEPEPEPEEEP